jgi:hypothetical protein
VCAPTTQQVVVLPLPSCDDLKCRVFAALARCYALLGSKPKELKAALRKGADIALANRSKLAPTVRRACACGGACACAWLLRVSDG